MNRHLATVVFALTFLTTAPGIAAERTATLKVGNLYCASCPYIVQKTLAAVPGVKDVVVSFAQKTAVVTFDDNKTNVDVLTGATVAMGFPSTVLNQ